MSNGVRHWFKRWGLHSAGHDGSWTSQQYSGAEKERHMEEKEMGPRSCVALWSPEVNSGGVLELLVVLSGL